MHIQEDSPLSGLPRIACCLRNAGTLLPTYTKASILNDADENQELQNQDSKHQPLIAPIYLHLWHIHPRPCSKSIHAQALRP